MNVKQITKLKEIKYKHSGVKIYVCRAVLDPEPNVQYHEIMFVSLNYDGTVQSIGFPMSERVNLEKIKRQTEFTDNTFVAEMVHMQVRPLLEDCNIVEDGPKWLNIYNV